MFTNDMLRDILKINVAPGGSLMVRSNLQRAMCILNSLPTSATQVAEYQRTEQNYWEMAGMHTFADPQEKSKGEPRMPVDDYETVKQNITMHAMYLLTLFGDQCQHYQGICEIRRMLHHHEGNTTQFSAKYCREIT